jgi:hypothetical protein
MKNDYVRTDSFVVKKHNLRIYRVAEPDSAVLLWTSEQPAVQYVQKLHIQKLLANKKGW